MIVRELLAKFGLDVDSQSFAKGQIAANIVTSALGKLVEAATHVVESFVENVKGVAEYGAKIEELAQSAGLTTTELQQLGKAAAEEGIPLENFAHSLVLLSRSMAAAKDGSEEQAKAFRKIGVSYKNQDGTLRSAGDVFEDLADHFSKMPDGAEKTAQALKFLGRSGAEMIPVLNKGRESIEKFRGAKVMDEEQIKAGKEFVVLQRQIAAQTKLLWREAIGPLLPAINDLLRRYLEWKKANGEIMKQRIRQFVGYIITGIEKLGDVFGFLVKNAGAVKLILGAAGLTGVLIKLGEISVSTAARTVVAWVAAAAPFIAIAAAVAALLLVYDDLRVYQQDQNKHSKKQHSLYGTFKEQLDTLYKNKEKPPFLVHFVEFVETIRSAGQWLANFRKELSEIADYIADALQAYSAASDFLSALRSGDRPAMARAIESARQVMERNKPAIAGENPYRAKYGYAPGPPVAGRGTEGSAPTYASFSPTIVQRPGEDQEGLVKRIDERFRYWWEGNLEGANAALKY